MNLQTRVSKLEQVTGINEPCEVCEAVNRSGVRASELKARLGIVVPEKPPAPLEANCGWCLRPITIDLRDFNEREQELYARMRAVYPAGTLCLPENKTLYDELTAAFERVEREVYGEHYETLRETFDIFLDELAEISTRRAPRLKYICRVSGCACTYPKTLDEYNRRLKVRGIAA